MDLLSTPVCTTEGDATTLGRLLDGRSALLVNVASRCGFTPQYAGLQALQEAHGDEDFTVLGFPCNQFGGQEPGSASEIAEFCSATYGVTFPVLDKVDVNGPHASPLWKALTEVADAEGLAGEVQWNFEKFLVSADGTTVTRFRSTTDPAGEELRSAVGAVTSHATAP